MSKRPRDLLLLVAAFALLVSTSNMLVLCVHEDEAGLQVAWDECCVTASPCCKPAATPETSGQAVGGHTRSCEDYAIASTFEWIPTAAQETLASPWSLAIQSPAPATYRLCTWTPHIWTPSRAPPPDRSLRTVNLRC